MSYVIQDTKTGKYLVKNPYSWTDDLQLALRTLEKKSAENLINCTYKTKFKKDNITSAIPVEVMESILSNGQDLTSFNYESVVEKTQDICSALYALKHIQSLYNYWINQERTYEQMTQDILHKIELEDMSNYIDAFLLVKKLKEIRIKRREAKDNALMLNLLIDSNLNLERVSEASKFYDQIRAGLKTYKPRQLPEIFETKQFFDII